MDGCRLIFLGLTYEEAYELFSRCLRSAEDDNEASRSAMRKLGVLLDERQDSQKAA